MNHLECVELLPRYFWGAVPSIAQRSDDIHFFKTDHVFVYEPFYADFGPLHLGHVHRYCQLIDLKLSDSSLENKIVFHYCSDDPESKSNSIFLCASYLVVRHGFTPETALALFNAWLPSLTPYRDATYGQCSFALSVSDCVHALYEGMTLSWYDFHKFDVDEYEKFEKVENGDLNWVIPNKFIAFSGPAGQSPDDDGFAAFTPEDYIPIFKQMNVSRVMRLNVKQYDRRRFTDKGINHSDLYFVDGSCPSREIIRQFMEISEREDGAMAVHCKAGLGRTGTLIGCYAFKHYRFPARYWVGWNRICRPGSILGPQQHFLLEIWKELVVPEKPMSRGVAALAALSLSADEPNKLVDVSIDSEECLTGLASPSGKLTGGSTRDKVTAEFGDLGQGERLVQVRRIREGDSPRRGDGPTTPDAQNDSESADTRPTTPEKKPPRRPASLFAKLFEAFSPDTAMTDKQTAQ